MLLLVPAGTASGGVDPGTELGSLDVDAAADALVEGLPELVEPAGVVQPSDGADRVSARGVVDDAGSRHRRTPVAVLVDVGQSVGGEGP